MSFVAGLVQLGRLGAELGTSIVQGTASFAEASSVLRAAGQTAAGMYRSVEDSASTLYKAGARLVRKGQDELNKCIGGKQGNMCGGGPGGGGEPDPQTDANNYEYRKSTTCPPAPPGQKRKCVTVNLRRCKVGKCKDMRWREYDREKVNADIDRYKAEEQKKKDPPKQELSDAGKKMVNDIKKGWVSADITKLNSQACKDATAFAKKWEFTALRGELGGAGALARGLRARGECGYATPLPGG